MPHDKDAGNESLGFLVLKDESNGTILQEISLRQQTKSMLQLKEFIVAYVSEDNKEEEDVFDERDADFRTAEFAKPGTNVTLRFTLENLFDNSYEEGSLEDLQITLEADDEDLFAESFSEEYELDPLAADKTIEFWVSFLIADDADAGDYTFEIAIEAEDEKGARHSVNRELLLDVQREDDDVRITKAALLPATLSCATEFTLDVAIKNFGADNQDHAGITIFSQKLGINKHVKDIELEEFDEDDTTWDQQFRFSVPSGISAGSYPLEVRAFVDQDQLEEIFPLSLQVGSCAPEEENTVEDEEPEEQPAEIQVAEIIADEPEEAVTEIFQEGTQQISSSAIVATVENPYTLQDVLVAMLFVSVVLTLAIITLLLSNLVAPLQKGAPKMEKKAEEKGDRSQKRKTNREVK